MKKTIGILAIVAILVIATVSFVSAGFTGPVEPQTPPPAPDGSFTQEALPEKWFVELSSPPTVKGTPLATLLAEKERFISFANTIGLKYTVRYTFNDLWNGFSISIAKDDVAKLRAIPGVKAIYPVFSISLPEDTSGDETELYTALTMTGADVAHSELGYTGAGVNVAIVDTGVDYDHPDLGGCFGAGCRVFTGYDFVGDDYDAETNPVPVPDDDPDDCNGHGTHVTGIAAANGTVVGVAPGANIGAYRVFGCEGSTDTDIMAAAMERALADGMDVLNMSIGSAFWGWPQYPSAVAADNLVDSGVVVVASIGNSGTAGGLYAAGAPGTGSKVIGVASFDNTHQFLPYFTVGDQHMGYIEMTYSGPVPTSGTFEIVYVGRGCDVDLPFLADPAGKVALIERGACSFGEKAQNGIDAGAAAVVVHNNAVGNFNGTLGATLDGVTPVVSISQADGLYIRGLNPPVNMTWTDQMEAFPSPTGGLVSSFSSYGLAPDLSFKPDIGAPGGNIYSTYPLELGGYANLGGTSMSSPHVAGAAALLLEAKPSTPALAVRSMLQNSADPKDWWGYPGVGLLEPAFRQGAGMLDIDDAILATTTIVPAKLAVGEGEAGPQTFTLWVTNQSLCPVTYNLSWESAIAVGGVLDITGYWLLDENITFSQDSIDLPPLGVATVDVTITPPTPSEEVGHALYGGYIYFDPDCACAGQPYSVPYAGFVGDYQAIDHLANDYELPWLAFDGGDGYFYQAEDGHLFTMREGDIPYILLHLEHQVEVMTVEIYNAETGMPIRPFFYKAYDETYFGRSSTHGSFWASPWDGYRIVGETTLPVRSGYYQLVLRVLKALGDPDNPDHWQTWTSPMFVVHWRNTTPPD